MSLTQDLIALIRARPVSDDDLQQAALFTLDAIACAYAGCNTPVGEILRSWARADDFEDIPTAAVYTPDGARLVTGDFLGKVRFWEVKREKGKVKLEPLGQRSTKVAAE